VVLLSEIAHVDDAAACAQKIIAALVAPHDVAHHQLHVTATIGISIYPDDGLDAETLIKCADTAMYHAKDRGRNNYQFFERDMNARAVERQWIEAGLHRALTRHEFVLHYQPKIDLDTGAMTGAEALIRWVHPERGLMLPGDFVPVAEDCGLIVPIGQWVLREACRQARAWIDEGRPMAVAVNISAVEFRDPRFLDNLRTILGDSRLEARYLELELTESSLIQQGESTVLALQALKDLGVQVALDDFGTGYSSLSYLRQFPIDVLKVDRAFVHEISADPAGTSIVCAVISMGKSLGHRVIAEGVETGEQLAFLQAQHCSEGQGYFFSRPVAADEFVRLLDTRPAGTGPPVFGDTERAADALDVMIHELGAPAVGARALGLRGDQERRQVERRATARGTRDRRQSVRRRANFRSLIFTAVVLAAPHQLKHSPLTFSDAQRAPEVLLPPSVGMAIAIPLSQAYDGLIHEAAALYGVSPTLIRSVMQAESAFDPAAISRAGAMGLMQLMPDVARAFGIADPFDPRQNIMGGTRLLAELLDSQHNNIPLVLAAYNAGPAAVARYGGVPPFRETRDYVRKITHLIADARSAGND
jgi:EAL domain-containing protein (putative c-di-GMP-specific phosphodiesterase class I)/soluble lytic murein transglycosylase-like protein